jgi:FADH2 O2-dependent halogenase
MIRDDADVAVLGAGFAGSLMALVLQRVGRRPVLIERGTHPRFAIGESSTPLANLVLEQLSRRYDLPRLFPLTEYGRWQRAYPELTCGLKRGFTFVQHEPGRMFQPSPDHVNDLLVAASPNDEVGDMHWYRAEVDHFLVREAERAGVAYHDRTDITSIERDGRWRLRGRRGDEAVEIDAGFLIDATGPAGALARTLGIPTDPVDIGTSSWSVYSHLTGVERWEDVLHDLGASTADHPYHCDDAALHHVLDDGWIWVLRFNNGITSAGVAYDGSRRTPDLFVSPYQEWQRVLGAYPGVARQFARAEAVRPWVRTGRLQRRARQVAGPDWAMLPHAAYFLDPLFSTGIAHSMLGIERLAQILERPGDRAGALANYADRLQREIQFVDWLVHGCYRTFGRFELLAAFTMYYFTGAVQSEERRRDGRDAPDEGLLFSHVPAFRSAVEGAYRALLLSRRADASRAAFADELYRTVAEDIRPYNTAGFCDAARRNMYPFVSSARQAP